MCPPSVNDDDDEEFLGYDVLPEHDILAKEFREKELKKLEKKENVILQRNMIRIDLAQSTLWAEIHQFKRRQQTDGLTRSDPIIAGNR